LELFFHFSSFVILPSFVTMNLATVGDKKSPPPSFVSKPISWLTFGWGFKLLKTGWGRALQDKDLLGLR